MWKLMMNELLDLGMGVYLTSGTHWATSNVPGLDPDSQQAMQVLAMSKQIVNAGARVTALAKPGTTRATNQGQFLGAYAYKFDSQEARNVSGRYNYTRTAVVDGTMIDLADETEFTEGATVYDQAIDWTAPDDGQYVIFAYWAHGAYQSSNPAAVTSYATNYFDARGVEALREFWEANYLDDPVLNQKILEGDVQLFMDSLEISPSGGVTWWAEDIFEEFEARKGYDIFPHIFLVEGLPQVNAVYNAYFPPAQGSNDLAGEEGLREKYVNDWVDVLTQLYSERLLGELKTWLNSVGIKTRAQISYGRSFEITEPSMYVDYPEAEVFNQYNNIDIMRLHVAGGKLQNKVVSVENSTHRSNSSATPQMHLEDAYYSFAAGVQRNIWHLWGANYGYGTPIAWPGNWAGMAGFTRFSTRNPNFVNYDEFNAHLGRVQQLMQTGKSRTDIGFIHNNWNQGIRYGGSVSLGGGGSPNQDPLTGMNWMLAHQGVYYRSTELQDNGYTYDYFSPKFLYKDYPDANIYFDENTKTIEPAGYRALVLYQNWLDVKGAESILAWAQKGLPVVIMDGAAVRTPFADGNDAELAAIIAELKALPTVRTAAIYDATDGFDYFKPIAQGYSDGALEALQELGVRPYAEFVEPNKQILTQSRVDESGNMYLYAFNYCPNDYHERSYIESVRTLDHGTNIQTEIKMDGMYIPYFIDAWSGEVTELANYRYENGQTVFPIDIDFDNIALFAFEAVDSEKLHIVSTDAESAYVSPGSLVVRATESGLYNTVLSNGVSYQQNVTVPAPYDITDWDVTIESWTRNATASDLVRTETLFDVTTVNSNTSTVKTDINAKLDTLTTWNNIPNVGRDVSGLGQYAAVFHWDADKADGAYLNMGDTLASSIAVWINGKKVGGDISANPTKVKRNVGGLVDGQPVEGKDLYSGGVNWTKPIVDIGPYLVNGANKIVIQCSTDLTNVSLALRLISSATNRSGYWRYDITYRDYGPSQAVIVPYVEEILPTDKVLAEISTSSAVVAESPVSYFVSLSNVKDANLVKLSFTADGTYLNLTEVTPLGGFSVLEPLAWEDLGNNLWKGTVTLMKPGNITNAGTFNILEIKGVARGVLGDTTVTLTDFSIWGLLDGKSSLLPSEIKTTEAATSVVSKAPVYSKYDLNHDGRVDELDLSIAIYFYLKTSMEPGWDTVTYDIATAKDADVTGDNIVNLVDLVEIIANYRDFYNLFP